jgi:sialate O-acetylesterase
MSAVCYIFGKEIQAARNVPVGLMNTNWGGTAIQDWMPAAAMEDCAHATTKGSSTSAAAAVTSAGEARLPLVATHLYNAMVSPLRNHSIQGVIWYQGEANEGSPLSYACQLPAMVKHWRGGWGKTTDKLFPFGVVQLAGDVNEQDPLALPIFRWIGQTQGAGSLPNAPIPQSFLATAYDLGDATSPYGSVHIRYKKDVGRRLALGARRLVYGESQLSPGPVLASAVAVFGPRPSPSRVVLTFNDLGPGGLKLSPMNISKVHNMTNWDGSTPFEFCSTPADSSGSGDPCDVMNKSFAGWSLAPRTSLGADGRSIVLDGFGSAQFPPRAVRYGWRAYPCEARGCGVHTDVENTLLPPAPCYAVVKQV